MGIPPVVHTVASALDIPPEYQAPAEKDPYRPWCLVGRHRAPGGKEHYTSRSGGGDDAVVERPSKTKAPKTWTDQVDAGLPVEKPRTTYQACIELTSKANKLYQRAKPRPKSASRAVWGNWEARVDRTRTKRSVSAMCQRSDGKDLGRFAHNSGLPARKVPHGLSAAIAKTAEDKMEENMREVAVRSLKEQAEWKRKQQKLKNYEGRHGTKQRPASAMSRSPTKESRQQAASRPTSAVVRSSAIRHSQAAAGPKLHHSYLDVENKTLDVPAMWNNAKSVQYDLHEQLNAGIDRGVLHRPNKGLADITYA